MTNPSTPLYSDLPACDLGPYRLERRLGRGGMGVVFSARDTRLDRRVAVKHMRSGSSGGSDGVSKVRARFRREAWAAARISHPSVVPVFDVVERASGDWIVMEYVDGPTLKDLVEQEPLNLADVLRYGSQVAEGLQAAHGAGLVHRDLKSENVMIAPSGHAKILDFGLVKHLEPGPDEPSLTLHGEVMGTARVMSPEQARGLAVDTRSDLFSLGILLYEITTGVSPFKGKTALDTLSRVVSHQAPAITEWRPDLPPELSRLIQQLLEKAPERRPPAAADVAAELRRLAALNSASENAASEAAASEVAECSRSAWQAETLDLSSSALDLPAQDHLRACGKSLTALRARLFRRLFVGKLRRFPNRLRFARLDSAKNSQLSPAADFRHRLLRPSSKISQQERSGRPSRWAAGSLSALMCLILILGALRIRSKRVELAEDGFSATPEQVRSSLEIWHQTWGDLKTARDREALESSLGTLTRLVADEPGNAAVHVALAEAYVDKYRHTKEPALLGQAQGLAEQAIALDGSLISAHTVLAGALYGQGFLSQAAAEIQRALELQPSPSLYLDLGIMLYAQGLYPQAAESYGRALHEGGEHQSQIWIHLGDAQRRIPGREQEARQAFKRTIALIEESSPPEGDEQVSRQSCLALTWAKLAEVETSRDLVAMLRGLEQLDPASRYRLAVASEINGDRSSALELLAAALEAGFPAESAAADPELEDLRLAPEYHRILARIGSLRRQAQVGRAC